MAEISVTFVIDDITGEIVDIKPEPGKALVKKHGKTIKDLATAHGQPDSVFMEKPKGAKVYIVKYNPTCIVWYSAGQYHSLCTG